LSSLLTAFACCRVTAADNPMIAADIANNIMEREKTLAICISLYYLNKFSSIKK
jgi:hypothetical protein